MSSLFYESVQLWKRGEKTSSHIYQGQHAINQSNGNSNWYQL